MAKPGKPIGAMHQSLNLSPWGAIAAAADRVAAFCDEVQRYRQFG